MARPIKEGLDYYPLSVDFFEDTTTQILKARYGSDGPQMLLYIRCRIYKNGYYIKYDDDFEYIIADYLGTTRNKVKQVLNFLLKRSLFNDKLFRSDKVLTSKEIQETYQFAVKERAKKRSIEIKRYWLLNEEETAPYIKCTLFEENPGKTDSCSRKNPSYSAEKSLNKSKVNTIYNIEFQSAEVEEQFAKYILVYENKYGEVLPEQKEAMVDDLMKLSVDPKQQLEILRKATAGAWKNFYKLKAESIRPEKTTKKKQSFDNFERRKYDMESLEEKLLKN